MSLQDEKDDNELGLPALEDYKPIALAVGKIEFSQQPLEVPKMFTEPIYIAPPRVPRMKDGVPMAPKGERILVLQSKFVQRSVIYIPDKAQAPPTTGRVVAIGPDVEFDFVELDELVVFSLYAGVPINIIDGENKVITYLCLTPAEIAGKLLVDESKLEQGVKP